ncbi:hypothetical protein GCM10011364_13490 [Mangrovimonas yunxiaonensis]|nr:hypothetical protein GCM10011364_13490 [Mangrovimonas yunxiaonensis]
MLACGLNAQAQVTDGTSNSTSIPAENTDNKDEAPSLDFKPLPQEAENTKTLNGLSLPEGKTLNIKNQKEFSMFGEAFGNPGELYKKRFEKTEKSLQPSVDNRLTGETSDQYLGDYKTNVGRVNVVYRDFGEEDGDLIRVYVNDDVRVPSAMLQYNYKGFHLDLVEGFNKIDFQALNQGRVGPNTAELKVVDDEGNVIASSNWNLASGVKATIILIKE